MKEAIVLIKGKDESKEVIVFLSRKRAVKEFEASISGNVEMFVAQLNEEQ